MTAITANRERSDGGNAVWPEPIIHADGKLVILDEDGSWRSHVARHLGPTILAQTPLLKKSPGRRRRSGHSRLARDRAAITALDLSEAALRRLSESTHTPQASLSRLGWAHGSGLVPSDSAAPKRNAAPAARIALHHAQIGADERSEIDLVDDEEIRLRDPRPAFSGNLVASGDVDDVNREVGQIPAELRRQVVAAALDEQQLGMEDLHQAVQRHEIWRDVVADGRVGNRRFDGECAGSARDGRELGVLLREMSLVTAS